MIPAKPAVVLLACPFCGSDSAFEVLQDVGSVIRCGECSARTVGQDSDRKLAREEWNRRDDCDLCGWPHTSAPEPVNAAPSSAPVAPTDEMADSVRGILQSIRNNPGVTYAKVRSHCIMRGDNVSNWPQWVEVCIQSYVTEQGAANLIYSVMQANAHPAAPEQDESTIAKLYERVDKAESMLASLADTVASALRNSGRYALAEEIELDADLRDYVWQLSYVANQWQSKHDAIKALASAPVEALLHDAWERMDRARRILTDDNLRPECNWGMLDTTMDRAARPQESKRMFVVCERCTMPSDCSERMSCQLKSVAPQIEGTHEQTGSERSVPPLSSGRPAVEAADTPAGLVSLIGALDAMSKDEDYHPDDREILAEAAAALSEPVLGEDARLMQAFCNELDTYRRHAAPMPVKMVIWDAMCDAIGKDCSGDSMRAAMREAITAALRERGR